MTEPWDDLDDPIGVADRAFTRRRRRRLLWVAAAAADCAAISAVTTTAHPLIGCAFAVAAAVIAGIWGTAHTRAAQRTPGERAALLLLRHELAPEPDRRA